MAGFFAPLQEDILKLKEKLSQTNLAFDKTNQMFLQLNLNLLEYFASEDPQKLDIWCEYNIKTMHEQFENIVKNQLTDEKSQGVLLMFFFRIAKEIQVKYSKIENRYLEQLYTIMTSKGYKYPSYIDFQKNFALEKMPENIKRHERLK